MQKTIVSYNVNGIRAALRKGFFEWLQNESPDIICLQESKAGETDIDWNMFNILGYRSYYHFAEKKGYSGVVTLTKDIPEKTTSGIGIDIYDKEGRVVRTDFDKFTLVNVYIPSGTMGDIRQDFKMEFLVSFGNYISDLRKEREKIVVCGDYNICHKPIDINYPEKHKKSSGFLPAERAWLDEFVESGFTDAFRMFNAEPEKYTWWSYRANSRAKNLGWRIDYHFVTEELKGKILNAEIMPNVQHSDHCPIKLTLKF